jgi:hypothetical protein
MASSADKEIAMHSEAIERESNQSLPSTSDLDEKIIHQLEHTGEEVGLTWRTILAVIVSVPTET